MAGTGEVITIVSDAYFAIKSGQSRVDINTEDKSKKIVAYQMPNVIRIDIKDIKVK